MNYYEIELIYQIFSGGGGGRGGGGLGVVVVVVIRRCFAITPQPPPQLHPRGLGCRWVKMLLAAFFFCQFSRFYRAVNKKCPGERHIVEPRGFF